MKHLPENRGIGTEYTVCVCVCVGVSAMIAFLFVVTEIIGNCSRGARD